MPAIVGKTGAVTVKAYRGDAKTLLAFDVYTEKLRSRPAGFANKVKPPGRVAYDILNDLRFETPEYHAQDPKGSAYCTLNAPTHKFRWIYVLGQAHQGPKPAYSTYTYTVTPRYFDAKASTLTLVDHFGFLDRTAPDKKPKGTTLAPTITSQTASSVGWFLGTTDAWVHEYFGPQDLHSLDRQLFAS
jgi:hypothetical protein